MGGTPAEPEEEPPLALGRVIPGQGVDGLPGAIPTVMELLLAKAEQDTRLVLRTEPPEALSDVPVEGWVVRAGDRATLLRLSPQLDAPVDVWIERVDADGARLGTAQHLRIEPRPIEAVDGPARVGPELHARGPGLCRGSRPITGVAGLELGHLRWHRQPFARMDEVETRITVVVDDPQGILEPLPAEIVIPAGERSVDQPEPVILTDRAGTARVHFRWDGREDSLELRSLRPEWTRVQAPPRIPIGGATALEAMVAPSWATERMATCVLAGDGRLELVGSAEATLDRMSDRVLFEFIAAGTGKTKVRFETERLPPLELEIEVTEPTVELSSATLRLHPGLVRRGGAVTLTPIRGGELRLNGDAPPGLEVAVVKNGLSLRFVAEANASDHAIAVDFTPPERGRAFVRVDEQPGEGAPTHYFIEAQE